MRSRRQFIQLSLLTLIAPATWPAWPEADAQGEQQQVWLPLALAGGPPAVVDPTPPEDMPLLAPPSGSAEQAAAWLSSRCAGEYTGDDVVAIVDAYRRVGEWAGLDWFLALAQLAHETGHLTSWWSGRPRRNPAGIGVTGETRADPPDAPPGPEWAWDEQSMLWRAGWSFPTWAEHAVPAHLGRLLAYALTDDQASQPQRDLIAYALAYRPLPASYRGAAPTVVGLNGRWAVPGTTYGQRIIELAWQMQQP
jgi:hypothetical protein